MGFLRPKINMPPPPPPPPPPKAIPTEVEATALQRSVQQARERKQVAGYSRRDTLMTGSLGDTFSPVDEPLPGKTIMGG